MSTQHQLRALLGLGLLGTVCACGSATKDEFPRTRVTIVAGSSAAPPVTGNPGATPPAATSGTTVAPPPVSPLPGTAPTAPSAPQPVTPGAPPTMAPGAIPPNPAAAPTPAAPSVPMNGALAMDECGLKTDYPGDNYCIKPPPADKGFQLHVGPASYTNPDPQYILRAGQEVTNDFPATSGNTQKQFFYFRQFRMRPGAHHNIITVTGGTGLDIGRRIGTSNHLSEDSPKGNMIAPENKGVGIPIDPNQRINVSLHSINTTDKTMLREVWINFWYRDASEVTEPVQEMFQTGDVAFAIQPHEDRVLGPFSCSLQGNGRMLWFYGHRHANNVRFSAWRIRGAQKDLFYEGYNWEDPMVLEYSSTVVNPKVDTANMIEGGWSGILDFKTGDTIQWECHIVNKTDGVLRFTNNTYTGEMCIMDAELVGVNCGSLGL